jgi:aspartate kinase
VSTDDFGNGDVLPASYDVAGAVLRDVPGAPSAPEVAVVTGFLARGITSGAITTLGRGGSDLTATVLGRALGVAEVQVWKDVDGVLSADPRLAPAAVPVPFLTYEEATELAYFGAQVLHPQAMMPAITAKQNLNVRVKNSYNIGAPGTLITRSRDMANTLLTSVVRKGNVTLLDIVSTRMLGQYGFLAKVFTIMEANQISVDVVATSEVSVSLTLDPAKLWSRGLVDAELARLREEFAKFADVNVTTDAAILSLIGNVARSNEILERTFRALGAAGITVKMISQGASKVNISLLVDDKDADRAVRALHLEFFEGANAAAGAHAAQVGR